MCNFDVIIVYNQTKSYKSGSRGILETMDMTQYESNETHIYFPLILGMSGTTWSQRTNPILSSFNMGQISATATSVVLSDTDQFPTFYRYVNFLLWIGIIYTLIYVIFKIGHIQAMTLRHMV